jgi:hypothetical protein
VFEKAGQKEIAVGFSQKGADAWRRAFGPILKEFEDSVLSLMR